MVGKRRKTPLVYLDQFAWVALARARLRRKVPSHLRNVRRQLLLAASEGRAIFPLSLVHYLETWKQSDGRRRGELASEMALLSGFAALAPGRSIWPVEVEHALNRCFGKPSEPRPLHVLGRGAAFAFGYPDIQPDISSLTPRQQFRGEWAILASLEGNYAKETRERIEQGRRFAEVETARSVRLKGWRSAPREKEQRFRVQTLSDFHRDVITALIANDVAISELELLGPDGLERLVGDIPTLWVLTELRRIRYANPSQGFTETDLNDLRALAVALSYCQVVVTDKAWVDAVKRTGVNGRFGSLVTHNLSDVVGFLDSITVNPQD